MTPPGKLRKCHHPSDSQLQHKPVSLKKVRNQKETQKKNPYQETAEIPIPYVSLTSTYA